MPYIKIESGKLTEKNSPNVFFTIKKFKLLRLGAVDRT